MTEFTEQIRLYEPHRRQPRIAAIGGGHGLSAMLRGLKTYTKNITAIVTVADDGGGSGMLREDLGMLPPGDIRNCIMALANTEPTMQQLLNYRFTDGSLAGQSFGNLFLAAMNGISGSFDEAVHRMGDVLAITGRVLPVTNQDVRLEAEFHDGSRTLGESKIFYAKKINNSRIRKVRLCTGTPDCSAGECSGYPRCRYCRDRPRKPVYQHYSELSGRWHRRCRPAEQSIEDLCVEYHDAGWRDRRL